MPAIAALGLDYGEGNLFGIPRPAEFYLGTDEKKKTSQPEIAKREVA